MMNIFLHQIKHPNKVEPWHKIKQQKLFKFIPTEKLRSPHKKEQPVEVTFNLILNEVLSLSK